MEVLTFPEFVMGARLCMQLMFPVACGAGAEKIMDLGELTEFEQAGLKDAIPELKASIAKGIEFAQA